MNQLVQFFSENTLMVAWIALGILGSGLSATGVPWLVAVGKRCEALGCDLPKLKPQAKKSSGVTGLLALAGFVVGGLVALQSLPACASLGGDAQKADDAVRVMCNMQPQKLAIVQTIAAEHEVPVVALVDVVCAGQRASDAIDVDSDALLAAHKDLVDAMKRLSSDIQPEPVKEPVQDPPSQEQQEPSQPAE